MALFKMMTKCINKNIQAQIGIWCELELRYNHNHDPSNGRFISGGSSGNSEKVLTGGKKSDIINSGGISGALNPYDVKAKEHAERYYQSVRKMTNDVNRIAENTGFDKSEIQSIKNYIFMEKHDLGHKTDYFDASYEMAETWQRLIDGKNIQPHDITLLNHEIMERKLVGSGMPQAKAHLITSKAYNYQKEAGEFYGKIKKHNKT